MTEISFHAHSDPFHRGFGHCLRGIAVQIGNVFAERTVVDAYTDGGAALPADLNQFTEALPRNIVVLMEIAGIDPDFVHHTGNLNGSLRREMNIRNNRYIDAFSTKAVAYSLDMGYILQSGHGDAYHFSTCPDHCSALGKGPSDIIRMGVAHCLDDDPAAATYNHRRASDAHFFSNQSHCC